MTKIDRIYLVGPRGSGKTTVGRLLAERLECKFLDADVELEAGAGRSIAEIFAAEGESGFRAREAKLLAELARLDGHVIACGGGMVLRPENRERLRNTGLCVWLAGEPATLCRRIDCDPTTASRRPALTNLSGSAEMERLVREREPHYREVAHLAVDTDGRSPDEVVSAILSACSNLPSTCR
jgi:shikimate kinase